MQNATIVLLCRHSSIRTYKPTPLTQEQIDSIVKTAQSTSSSNFLQYSTVIRITDTNKREQLFHFAGDQKYINQSPEFWVFCSNFNCHYQIDPNLNFEKAEQLLIDCVDTALKPQNAVITAESLGLDTVYIGGLCNNIDKVTQLLTLPKYVIPRFGLCIGYSAHNPEIKPRLPKELVFFENQYKPINQTLLAQYDNQMDNYYAKRSTNQKAGDWSNKIAEIINNKQRDFILHYLHQQG